MSSNSDTSLDVLLNKLDGSGSDQEWRAVRQLRAVLGDKLPTYLLARYRTQRSWKPRSAYLYHSVRYARRSEDAIELGKLAVQDRAAVVRYRACMLLAYSLRRDLLPFLEVELGRVKNDATRRDIAAAMDAIMEQNHNYFVDREHSGKVSLNIQ